MSSLRTPPAKPARRKLSSAGDVSSHVHSSSSSSSSSASSTSLRRQNSPSSPNRTRAFSSSVTEGLRPPLPPPKPTSLTLTNAQSGKLSKFSAFTRDQASRLRQIDLSQKRAEVSGSIKERLPEWRNRGAEVLEEARAKSEGWGKKGREAVDRWKKNKDSESYDRVSPTNQTFGSDPHVFGAPLVDAVDMARIENHNDELPAVVVRCIEYLDECGLEEIGLYRIPGSSTTVSKLRGIFDTGSDLDFKGSKEDPHAVAALLKMYLRELPDTILTDALSPHFNAAVTTFASTVPPSQLQNNAQSLVLTPTLLAEVNHLVSLLPRENVCLLRFLCAHLSRIDAHANTNKMNLSNLGLIFCPTLGISSILFRCFVKEADTVFAPRKGLPFRRTLSAKTDPSPSTNHRRSSSSPRACTPPPDLEFPSASALTAFDYYDRGTRSITSGVLNLTVADRRSVELGRTRRSMSTSGGGGGALVDF